MKNAKGNIVLEFLFVLAVVLVIALIIYCAMDFHPVINQMPAQIGPSADAWKKACEVFASMCGK